MQPVRRPGHRRPLLRRPPGSRASRPPGALALALALPRASWLLWTLCLLGLLPARGEATDLFAELRKFKPPKQILEQGKALGKVVQAEVEKKGTVAQVAKSMQKAVESSGVVKAVSDSSPKVATVIRHAPKMENILQVEGAIAKAAPAVSETLEQTDPNRMVAALKAVDTHKLGAAMDAIGSLQWWRSNWIGLLLLAFLPSVLGWLVWCKLRPWWTKRRGKPGYNSLGLEAEMRLLNIEGEGPLFAREALRF